jgi:hypothetical protein
LDVHRIHWTGKQADRPIPRRCWAWAISQQRLPVARGILLTCLRSRKECQAIILSMAVVTAVDCSCPTAELAGDDTPPAWCRVRSSNQAFAANDLLLESSPGSADHSTSCW